MAQHVSLTGSLTGILTGRAGIDRPRLSYHFPSRIREDLTRRLPALRRELALIESAQRDRGLFERLRDERVVRAIGRAYRTAAFYRSQLDPVAVHTTRGVRDLPRFPLIERRHVRHRMAFVAADIDPDQCFPYFSSGSTGEPIAVLRDLDSVHYQHLHFRLIERAFGVRGRFRPLRTAIVNLMFCLEPKSQLMPFLRYSKVTRCGLGAPEWQDPVAPLRFLSRRPGVIVNGSPTMLTALQEHAQRHDPSSRWPIRPAFLASSGGPLTPATRDVLQSFFRCPVVDCYTTIELGTIALECPLGGGFHVDGLACVVECLRPDGTPAEPGELGDLVLTGLHRSPMPLLRYRIGDSGTLSDSPCACGSVFPKIGGLIGRSGLMFVRADGIKVVPAHMSGMLRELPLLQHQIEQTQIGAFTLRYIKASGAQEKQIERDAGRAFRQCFGDDVAVTAISCSQLAEPGSKPVPYLCRVT